MAGNRAVVYLQKLLQASRTFARMEIMKRNKSKIRPEFNSTTWRLLSEKSREARRSMGYFLWHAPHRRHQVRITLSVESMLRLQGRF